MILETQDNRIVCRNECCVSYGVYNILVEDISTHGFAVSYDWFFVFSFSIPTIEFYASGISRILLFC